MTNIRDYKLVQAKSVHELESQVTKGLRLGFLPLGASYYNTAAGCYSQTMVLPEKETKTYVFDETEE